MIDPLPTEPVLVLHPPAPSEHFPAVRAWLIELVGEELEPQVAEISYQRGAWPETSYVILTVYRLSEKGQRFIYDREHVATYPLVRRWSGPMPDWFIQAAVVDVPWVQQETEPAQVECGSTYSLPNMRGFRRCHLPAMPMHETHRDSQGFEWTFASLMRDRGQA